METSQPQILAQCLLSNYEDLDTRIVVTHKLASLYGWTWKEIWEQTPYEVIKELIKLIDALEKDEGAFLCPEERAGYKNLLRQYGKKEN